MWRTCFGLFLVFNDDFLFILSLLKSTKLLVPITFRELLSPLLRATFTLHMKRILNTYHSFRHFRYRQVWDTDPYGLPHGPIASKYHIFTMEMCVYAWIVHCDITPSAVMSHTRVVLWTYRNVLLHLHLNHLMRYTCTKTGHNLFSSFQPTSSGHTIVVTNFF